jgi:starvation-inducible outer membrane lipoprotein
MAKRFLIVLAALVVASCATVPPAPRTLDGANRVPINDTATIEMLRRQAAGDGTTPARRFPSPAASPRQD